MQKWRVLSLVMVCVSLQAALNEDMIPLCGERKIKSYKVVRFKRKARVPKKAVVLTRFEPCINTPIFFHKAGALERTTSFDHGCLRDFSSPERKLVMVFQTDVAAPYSYNLYCDYNLQGGLNGGLFIKKCLVNHSLSCVVSAYDVARVAFLRSVKVDGKRIPYFYSPELNVLLRACYDDMCLGAEYKSFYPSGMRPFSDRFAPSVFFPEGYIRRWSVCPACKPLKKGEVRFKVGSVSLNGELIPEKEGIDPNVDRGEVFFAMISALQRVV